MGTLFFCIGFVKYTPDDWSLFQSGRGPGSLGTRKEKTARSVPDGLLE